jgi:hypothetical protein
MTGIFLSLNQSLKTLDEETGCMSTESTKGQGMEEQKPSEHNVYGIN